MSERQKNTHVQEPLRRNREDNSDREPAEAMRPIWSRRWKCGEWFVPGKRHAQLRLPRSRRP